MITHTTHTTHTTQDLVNLLMYEADTFSDGWTCTACGFIHEEDMQEKARKKGISLSKGATEAHMGEKYCATCAACRKHGEGDCKVGVLCVCVCVCVCACVLCGVCVPLRVHYSTVSEAHPVYPFLLLHSCRPASPRLEAAGNSTRQLFFPSAKPSSYDIFSFIRI